MPKVLISGAGGQLASTLATRLVQLPTFEVYPYNRQAWDVTDQQTSTEIFDYVQPDVYFNGSAIHNEEWVLKDVGRAFDVNVVSQNHILDLCNKHKTKFVNISTNYIYGGDESDNKLNLPPSIPSPFTVYGVSKLSFELILKMRCNDWINFRVSGVFGQNGSCQKNGLNFPFQVLNHLLSNDPMYVNDTDITNISYTEDIVSSILLNNFFEKSAVKNCHRNLINEGVVTWYEVATYIARLFNKQNLIYPVKKDNRRNTSLSLSLQIPCWKDAISRFIINDVTKIGKYKKLFGYNSQINQTKWYEFEREDE